MSGGPGCATAGHLGTAPTGIDTAGDIGGVYEDRSLVYHGFVRAANGTITTFDAPGASTVAGQGNQGTVPLSMSTAGVIAGTYADENSTWHSFVRAANGTTTTIDVPGARTGAFQGTIGVSINDSGIITGSYTSTTGVYRTLALAAHGFVRAADGTITTFDAPGAAADTGLLQGTISGRINTAASITGLYADTSGMLRGFVRLANGTTTTFDAPGAGTGTLQGTAGVNINDSGLITGVYADGSGVLHGFFLTPYPQAAAPSFSPVPGNYNSAQTVAISDTTPGAAIYYTTNGTTPTTSSTAYSDPITVNSTETIEAIATASGYSISAVASATYTITTAGPVAEVSPSSLSFAATMVNSSTSPHTVTLSNTGSAVLSVASIGVSANFAQTDNCGSSVAAGGTCTINVSLSPTKGGSLTGALTITDNSNNTTGSTQTVTLSGTGQDFTVSAASGSPTSATVAPGSSATYSLSVGAKGGMSGMVSFTCAGGALRIHLHGFAQFGDTRQQCHCYG